MSDEKLSFICNKKILNFGSLNIDNTYFVEHIVRKGETISAKGFQQFIGGKGLNQSIALRKAGVNVFHAGFVGERDGALLLNYLKQNDVKTNLIHKVKGNSGHAIIQIDERGNNSIVVEGGANRKITRDYIDQVLYDFDLGDYLVLQNEINNVDYIIEKAKDKGLKVYFNPSPINEDLKKVNLNLVDCILVNEIEGKELSKCSEVDDILGFFSRFYPNMEVVMTLGRAGGIYKYKNTIISYKSVKVDAVDTTGAGDTFCGYFIACQAGGLGIKKSLNIASLAAAIACTKNGASNSIPERKVVQEIFKKVINKGENNEKNY